MTASATLPRKCIRLLWRSLLLAIVCASCSICIAAHTRVPPASGADSTIEQPETLSLKTRQQIFEKTWKEIHEDYYDPQFNGVDWEAIRSQYRPRIANSKSDAEFYALMSEMTAELHDAHTRFN